jgi:hypothetical protein
VDIAQILGVSKERANQLSTETPVPRPAATSSRGRLWRRSDVKRWASDYEGGPPSGGTGLPVSSLGRDAGLRGRQQVGTLLRLTK